MCIWGTETILEVGGKRVAVDSCIAPLVEALNRAGVPTKASCCGHGRQPGNIALADGRELLLVSCYEQARQLERQLQPPGPPAKTWVGRLLARWWRYAYRTGYADGRLAGQADGRAAGEADSATRIVHLALDDPARFIGVLQRAHALLNNRLASERQLPGLAARPYGGGAA